MKRPWWNYWWSSFFSTGAMRKRRCKQAGTHHPELIEMGMAKLCFTCGAW